MSKQDPHDVEKPSAEDTVTPPNDDQPQQAATPSDHHVVPLPKKPTPLTKKSRVTPLDLAAFQARKATTSANTEAKPTPTPDDSNQAGTTDTSAAAATSTPAKPKASPEQHTSEIKPPAQASERTATPEDTEDPITAELAQNPKDSAYRFSAETAVLPTEEFTAQPQHHEVHSRQNPSFTEGHDNFGTYSSFFADELEKDLTTESADISSEELDAQLDDGSKLFSAETAVLPTETFAAQTTNSAATAKPASDEIESSVDTAPETTSPATAAQVDTEDAKDSLLAYSSDHIDTTAQTAEDNESDTKPNEELIPAVEQDEEVSEAQTIDESDTSDTQQAAEHEPESVETGTDTAVELADDTSDQTSEVAVSETQVSAGTNEPDHTATSITSASQSPTDTVTAEEIEETDSEESPTASQPEEDVEFSAASHLEDWRSMPNVLIGAPPAFVYNDALSSRLDEQQTSEPELPETEATAVEQEPAAPEAEPTAPQPIVEEAETTADPVFFSEEEFATAMALGSHTPARPPATDGPITAEETDALAEHISSSSELVAPSTADSDSTTTDEVDTQVTAAIDAVNPVETSELPEEVAPATDTATAPAAAPKVATTDSLAAESDDAEEPLATEPAPSAYVEENSRPAAIPTTEPEDVHKQPSTVADTTDEEAQKAEHGHESQELKQRLPLKESLAAAGIAGAAVATFDDKTPDKDSSDESADSQKSTSADATSSHTDAPVLDEAPEAAQSPSAYPTDQAGADATEDLTFADEAPEAEADEIQYQPTEVVEFATPATTEDDVAVQLHDVPTAIEQPESSEVSDAHPDAGVSEDPYATPTVEFAAQQAAAMDKPLFNPADGFIATDVSHGDEETEKPEFNAAVSVPMAEPMMPADQDVTAVSDSAAAPVNASDLEEPSTQTFDAAAPLPGVAWLSRQSTPASQQTPFTKPSPKPEESNISDDGHAYVDPVPAAPTETEVTGAGHFVEEPASTATPGDDPTLITDQPAPVDEAVPPTKSAQSSNAVGTAAGGAAILGAAAAGAAAAKQIKDTAAGADAQPETVAKSATSTADAVTDQAEPLAKAATSATSAATDAKDKAEALAKTATARGKSAPPVRRIERPSIKSMMPPEEDTPKQKDKKKKRNLIIFIIIMLICLVIAAITIFAITNRTENSNNQTGAAASISAEKSGIALEGEETQPDNSAAPGATTLQADDVHVEPLGIAGATLKVESSESLQQAVAYIEGQPQTPAQLQVWTLDDGQDYVFRGTISPDQPLELTRGNLLLAVVGAEVPWEEGAPAPIFPNGEILIETVIWQ